MIWYKNFNWKKVNGTKDDPLPDYLLNINNLCFVYEGRLKSRLDNYPIVVYLYVWAQYPLESEEYQQHNEAYECNCDNCRREILEGVQLNPFNVQNLELNYVLSFPTLLSRRHLQEYNQLILTNFMETFPHPYDGRLRDNSSNDHPFIAHTYKTHATININPTLIKAFQLMSQSRRSINYPGGI